MGERQSLCVYVHQSDGEFEAERTAGSTCHSLLHLDFEQLIKADCTLGHYIATLSVKKNLFIKAVLQIQSTTVASKSIWQNKFVRSLLVVTGPKSFCINCMRSVSSLHVYCVPAQFITFSLTTRKCPDCLLFKQSNFLSFYIILTLFL